MLQIVPYHLLRAAKDHRQVGNVVREEDPFAVEAEKARSSRSPAFFPPEGAGY
jgi:hypothetical protein